MHKEDFITHFKDWTNKRLIKEYKDLEDFEIDEIEAIREIFLSRGCLNELDKIDQLKNKIEEQERQQKNLEYLESKFGSTVDEKKYAASVKSREGIYFNKTVLAGAKSKLHGLLIGLGISLIILCIGFIILDFDGYIFMSPICLALSGGLFWYAKVLHGKNRSSILLSDQNSLPIICIKTKTEKYKFCSPFNYSTYIKRGQISLEGVTLENTSIYLLLRNENDFGSNILLKEVLSAKVKLLPNWEEIQFLDSHILHDLVFTQYGNEQLELEKLNRILEGLSTSHSNHNQSENINS